MMCERDEFKSGEKDREDEEWWMVRAKTGTVKR